MHERSRLSALLSHWILTASLLCVATAGCSSGSGGSVPDGGSGGGFSAGDGSAPSVAKGGASGSAGVAAVGGSAANGGGAQGGSGTASGGISGGAVGPAPDGSGPALVDGLDVGDSSLDVLDELDVIVAGKPIHFWLWLPGGVKVVRGLQINVQQGLHYVEFGRLVNFGILSFDTTVYHDAGNNSVQPILDAATQFGARTKHPELASTVFVATGHSASSSASFLLDDQAPQRLVSGGSGGLEFIPGGSSAPDPVASLKVPYMLFFGAADASQPMVLFGTDLPTTRAKRGLFAIAPQWGGGHSIGTSPNIVLPMWYQSIARRYPTSQDPSKGAVKLTDLAESGGWLGNVGTWQLANNKLVAAPHTAADVAPYASFSGDKSKAAWLLDSYMAHAWQAHEAPDDTVKLTDLPPLNKDDTTSTITLIEPGAKLAVTAEVPNPPSPLVGLDLYDGDLKLAQATSSPHKFEGITLPPGVHGILAVAHFQDGTFLTSRLTTVFSIRHTCPVNFTGGGFPARCVKP